MRTRVLTVLTALAVAPLLATAVAQPASAAAGEVYLHQCVAAGGVGFGFTGAPQIVCAGGGTYFNATVVQDPEHGWCLPGTTYNAVNTVYYPKPYGPPFRFTSYTCVAA